MDDDLPTDVLEGSFVEVETSPLFTCSHWGKSFARKYNRGRHLMTHDKDQAICTMCTICNLYFLSEEEKEAHERKKHPPLVCDACGVAFQRKSDLKAYISLKHADQNNNIKACYMPFREV